MAEGPARAAIVAVAVVLGALAANPAPQQFEPNMLADKEVIHKPYEWGDCSVCHIDKDPQKSGNTALVKEPPDLCYQCHDKKTKEGKKFIHGPVAAGACTVCHDPHKSKNRRLLVYDSINGLCTSCHIDKRDLLQKTDNIHPPVADNCIHCHDPHTENFKFQLKGSPKKGLCVMCHEDKKIWESKVKNRHSAMSSSRKCLNCHDPHGTGQPFSLKTAAIKDLCLQCHDKELVRDEDGAKLINMAKHLKEHPDWHGPIQWGDCATCHNPHGSSNFRMLKKPFPETFYASFDVDKYLCFECHDPKKVTEPRTTEATNFRNGDLNLHYLHVNKDKGRTCRACHDVHATKDYPHHLRKKTKFGRINFPIRFIETPTGGSCAPACHARRYYDRKNPVKNLK